MLALLSIQFFSSLNIILKASTLYSAKDLSQYD
jgi:hypothetical protein